MMALVFDAEEGRSRLVILDARQLSGGVVSGWMMVTGSATL